MFIDVHCHLDHFDNIEKIVSNARRARVELIITQGINEETNQKALELGKKFPEILVALWLYPIDSLKLNDRELEQIAQEIKQNKKRIVAIGEVGLDLKESQDLERQKKAFRAMIEIALELDVPIIVHSRKAEKECIEELESAGVKKVIMHCFSGKLILAKRIIENKWFLSIPSSVKNSEHFQKIVELTPIEQLLCETDSPYLHPDRKFPNEPCNVKVSYEMIAKIKNMKLKDVEKKIEENYYLLF